MISTGAINDSRVNATSVLQTGWEMDKRFEDGTGGAISWIGWEEAIFDGRGDEIERDDDLLDEVKFMVGCVEYSFVSYGIGLTMDWEKGINALVG